MESFRLVTYSTSGGPRAGIVAADRVYDAADLLWDHGCPTVLELLRNWENVLPALREAVARRESHPSSALEGVQLLAPILYPPAVFCAGANYTDHVSRMAAKLGLERFPNPKSVGSKPFHFLKASRCCVGPGAEVRAPSRDVDWEVELVAVIGKPARHVKVDEALSYVAGYMVGNDLTARDLARRPEIPSSLPFSFSWLDAKSFEDSAPIGPWIVPAEDVGDPLKLDLKTWVNGELKQDSNTSKMIFSVQEQIAYLSEQITLNPGDIIFTGTPAGAGAETGEFMKHGDTVTVWIEKIGQLTTKIV
ncbi:2-keto-4-pentenoate hydratase/2-oxohepta-3-ene-1,7-dioic acid hydratase in catechol pathway [Paraburkholderia sp. BL23I1N1]|uniref:fumarylacetoacetate hydrolase family protein n=1 Tax=Paraburkholderia sp. BL23I1N1 TaxID=1938802 RepID=UPI000E739588|nr:fumarylacetoacetate hydrolase family protein [Paraburkholderia sp. BL23I1N1]RKE38573.1 2-keto-4-pentenoate hydratase/2-oxohepta-3-ene-1,7-dioic acid hydratase in catechol pathway [Paraburkholderia sp. BL23I1N1]